MYCDVLLKKQKKKIDGKKLLAHPVDRRNLNSLVTFTQLLLKDQITNVLSKVSSSKYFREVLSDQSEDVFAHVKECMYIKIHTAISDTLASSNSVS